MRHYSPLGNTPSGNTHAEVIYNLQHILPNVSHPYNRRVFANAVTRLRKYRKSLSRAFTRADWKAIEESIAAAERNLARDAFVEAVSEMERTLHFLTKDPGGYEAAHERFQEENIVRAKRKANKKGNKWRP